MYTMSIDKWWHFYERRQIPWAPFRSGDRSAYSALNFDRGILLPHLSPDNAQDIIGKGWNPVFN